MKYLINSMRVDTNMIILTAIWLLVAPKIDVAAVDPCYLNTSSCTPVTTSFCLGAKISFTHTSLIFANDSSDLAEVERNLAEWSLLQRVPECWSVIQPFLCSVYLPKCDLGEEKVELPSKELCERTRGPCKVVQQYNGEWPDFLRCDAWFFKSACGQSYYETTDFNTTGICAAPLIRTSDETSWYGDIKGCGIKCENPLFTEEEHDAVHIFIAVAGCLCMICTMFTLLTFMIDWKVGRRYPAVILFFINGCFFLGSCGWMVQFIGDVRQDIICRADGTVRKGEPLIGSGESATCTIVFIMVYFFLMAGVVWFVMLAYSWDVTFKALGTVRDDLTKKTAYFHIISWCLPLVLTIASLAISQVDGDSLSGICFVGYFENAVRAGFVLAPIGLVLIVGMIFLIRGLYTLVQVRKDSPRTISDRATAKIRATIFRLGIFTGLAFAFVLVSFIVHLYMFTNEERWAKSFQDYIYCQANVSVAQIRDNKTTTSCEIEERPSLVAAIVHIFAFFGAGVAMSSWTWTKASLEAWQRFFRRLCNIPEKKPEKPKNHRLVAKAFKRRKRRDFRRGRLSFSYGSDRDDPLGMKLDLNSMSSQSLSSGYAVAMKKMARRKAMMNQARGMHKKSSESDLSSTVSRVSRSESRRHSYESSMSQKLSDIEREIRHVERMKRRKKRRKKRHMNRVQPVLEPISSAMAALQERKARRFRQTHGHHSDSSALSRASAHGVNVAVDKPNMDNSCLSSNILSESMTTNDSVSDISLPHNLTDFSVFAVNSGIPPGEKGDATTTLKGAKSSPSGSFRRGRKREYKLEMTETSFYQEDDENIEMTGNKTVHAQERTHESAELRTAMNEMSEFMENVRAASGNGRYSSERRNSGQRDPMGSGRLGSASSRGSRGSQSHGKELVPRGLPTAGRVPDRIVAPGLDFGKKSGSRPWSGNYLVSGDTGLTDSGRQGSATGHKRQIGNNGRIDRGSANTEDYRLNGKLDNTIELPKDKTPGSFVLGEFNRDKVDLDDKVDLEDKTKRKEVVPDTTAVIGTRVGSGSSKSGSGTNRDGSGNSNTSWSRHVHNRNQNIDVLDVAGEHSKLKMKPLQNVDLLDVSAEQHKFSLKPDRYRHKLKPSGNDFNKRLKPNPHVDILDISAEHHQRLKPISNADVLNVAAAHKLRSHQDQNIKVVEKGKEESKQRTKADVLNVSEEHRSNQNSYLNNNVTDKPKPKIEVTDEVTGPRRSEEHRRSLKRKHESSSAGSKKSERSQRSRKGYDSSRTSSATSNSSRTPKYDGIKKQSGSSKYDKFLASTILPGVELTDKILNLVDYDYDDDDDSDYDDDDIEYDDDLLETTSYDDELTEVSSLPC